MLVSRRIEKIYSPGLARMVAVFRDADGRESRLVALVDPREVREYPPRDEGASVPMPA